MKKLTVLFSILAFLLSVNAGMCASTSMTPLTVVPEKSSTAPKTLNWNDWRNDETLKKLNLNDNQVKQVKELRVNLENKTIPMYKQIGDKKREIFAIERSRLVSGEQKRRISAAEKEIKNIRKEVKKIKKESEKEFEALLTDEQLIAYGQMDNKKSGFVQVSFKKTKTCPKCITKGCSPNCEKGCPDNCSKNCPCKNEHSNIAQACEAGGGCPVTVDETPKEKTHSKLCPFGCPKGCPDNCDDTCRCKKRQSAKSKLMKSKEEAEK